MGVYIKGMEMPGFCAVCAIADWEYDCCPVSDRKNIRITDTSGRPNFCPLLEVLDHGDLIDKSVLYDHIKDGYDIDLKENPILLNAILEMVDYQEAVIPADKEEL